MSCCISSAVCCVLLTSSMTGVALGYNYSLAEYIDMKETNVSVYMKRGVFDDEAKDEDMDWRRSGHPSLKGFVRDEGNLLTAPPVEPDEMPLPKSGRRLDDTIVESDGNNKFEGSLMKLTVKPPHPSTTTEGVTGDIQMLQAMSSYTPGSLDQLKAIQGIINMRKSGAIRDPNDKKSTFGYDDRYLAHVPGYPGKPNDYRRMMGMHGGVGADRPEVAALKPPKMDEPPPEINPARFAVPSDLSQAAWMAPKLSPEVYRKVFNQDDDPPPYPKPVPYRTGPIRPPTTKLSPTPSMITTKPTVLWGLQGAESIQPDLQIPADKEIEELKARITEEKLGNDNSKKDNFNQKILGPNIIGNDNMDYYEDDMKGLPVRKKRSINKVRAKIRPQAKGAAEALPQKII